MFMMDSFKETELMDMEYTFIKMVRDMKVIGKMMFKKDREKKFYKMDQFMRDSLKMEKNGDMELTNGQINQNFKVTG